MPTLKAILVSLLMWPVLVWANDQTVLLSIRGMTCPLCVTAINKALRTTPGVLSAKTFLGREQAEVTVPEGFDLHHLLAAIEQAGYTGEVVDTDTNNAANQDKHTTPS